VTEMRREAPAQTSRPPSRQVQLPGMFNARELGGLRTGEGSEVRRGLLYRSDFPDLWGLDAAYIVGELGLARVVDLRRGAEALSELVDWPTFGVEYVRLPFVAAKADSWHAHYVGYLTHRPEVVVEAVRAVCDNGDRPVLFHCAAGKDRTGVLAALVLRMLGVVDEEIVADYLLSASSVVSVLGRLRRIPAYAEMLATVDALDQLPRPENMRTLLAWVDMQGGAGSWLARHGMAEEEQEAMRQRLLVPAGGARNGS
jgi:protein-tyrosine phosphatase